MMFSHDLATFLLNGPNLPVSLNDESGILSPMVPKQVYRDCVGGEDFEACEGLKEEAVKEAIFFRLRPHRTPLGLTLR